MLRQSIRWSFVALIAAVTLVPSTSLASNLLLIVIDDVGPQQIAAYGEPGAQPTPELDSITTAGVRFNNAWASPVCSPGRAMLMTGLYGPRNGIGSASLPGVQSLANEFSSSKFGLSYLSHLTLPNALRDAGYETAMFGKWHLAGCPPDESSPTPACSGAPGIDLFHPLRSGFDLHLGPEANSSSYCDWIKVGVEDDSVAGYRGVGGGAELVQTQKYLTIDTMDDARSWITDPSRTSPWFAYVAFSAMHAPLRYMQTAPWEPGFDSTAADNCTSGPAVDAYARNLAILDYAIGNIVNAMAPAVRANTTILVTADNGAFVLGGEEETEVEDKGSTAELGVRVPMIVEGSIVEAAGVSEKLVSLVDVFATFLDFAQVAPACGGTGQLDCPDDSVSFLHLLDSAVPPKLPGGAWPPREDRAFVYTDMFRPNNNYGDEHHTKYDMAIRNDASASGLAGDYKLRVSHGSGNILTLQLYDMNCEGESANLFDKFQGDLTNIPPCVAGERVAGPGTDISSDIQQLNDALAAENPLYAPDDGASSKKLPKHMELDMDADGICDAMPLPEDAGFCALPLDNCPWVANSNQEDVWDIGRGGGPLGDACEDADFDSALDFFDNCIGTANPSQCDHDIDGYGQACDDDAGDFDGVPGVDANDLALLLACTSGGACDPSYDLNCDGSYDSLDEAIFAALPTTPGPSAYTCAGTIPCEDADQDGRVGTDDNCTNRGNPGQCDSDLDGYGNACDADFDQNFVVGITDFNTFGAALGNPEIFGEDHDCNGAVGISDFNTFGTALGSQPGPSGLLCAGSANCTP